MKNQTFQHSLIFSHDDDQAETCGRPTPLMMMMTGICDRPKTYDDDEHERKRPKDGSPSPWKHGWTLNHQSNPHVSWSWSRPRSLDGTAHPLFVHCHVWKYGVWGSPGVCRTNPAKVSPRSRWCTWDVPGCYLGCPGTSQVGPRSAVPAPGTTWDSDLGLDGTPGTLLKKLGQPGT